MGPKIPGGAPADNTRKGYDKTWIHGLAWSQVAKRLGNRASNQKVAGLIPGLQNDVVSLGMELASCLLND